MTTDFDIVIEWVTGITIIELDWGEVNKWSYSRFVDLFSTDLETFVAGQQNKLP